MNDAQRLSNKFKGVNRAKFAREHSIKGGGAMIYQHINGIKPISTEHAIAYAKGFGCPIGEISPRAAALLAEFPALAPAGKEISTYLLNSNVREFKAAEEDSHIAELLQVAQSMSPRGIIELIGRAKELATIHPRVASKKRRS